MTTYEKNITGTDRNNVLITTEIFYSNLHKGIEVKKPFQTLTNHNQNKKKNYKPS